MNEGNVDSSWNRSVLRNILKSETKIKSLLKDTPLCELQMFYPEGQKADAMAKSAWKPDTWIQSWTPWTEMKEIRKVVLLPYGTDT